MKPYAHSRVVCASTVPGADGSTQAETLKDDAVGMTAPVERRLGAFVSR